MEKVDKLMHRSFLTHVFLLESFLLSLVFVQLQQATFGLYHCPVISVLTAASMNMILAVLLLVGLCSQAVLGKFLHPSPASHLHHDRSVSPYSSVFFSVHRSPSRQTGPANGSFCRPTQSPSARQKTDRLWSSWVGFGCRSFGHLQWLRIWLQQRYVEPPSPFHIEAWRTNLTRPFPKVAHALSHIG